MAVEAARVILRSGAQPNLSLTCLCVPDEKVGIQTSREIIAEQSKKAKYVLVAEGTESIESVVTPRMGSLKFDLSVRGVAAHSGVDHPLGRSALRELAQQILALEAMTDCERDITVNVASASGGTRADVVPEASVARVNVHFATRANAQAMPARITEMAAVSRDVSVQYKGGVWRLPYKMTESIAGLLQSARDAATRIGIELTRWAEPRRQRRQPGRATCCGPGGFGPVGGGAHTIEEWIDLTSLR